jgi:hypothetical protein
MVMLQLCVVLYKDSLLRPLSLITPIHEHKSDERIALNADTTICILRNGTEQIHLGRGYLRRLVPFRSAKYRLGVEICILRNGTERNKSIDLIVKFRPTCEKEPLLPLTPGQSV